MGKFEDLTGQTFGEWNILSYLGESYWLCKSTITGEEKRLHGYKLKNGKVASTIKKQNMYLKLHDKYNEWEIIEIIDTQHYRCRCSCGKSERIILKYDLVNGRTKSCGHDSEKAFKDLTGQQFGDWKVLEYAGNRMWKCQCQCKLGTIRNVHGYSLISGKSTSCGHPKKDGNEVKVGSIIENWTVLEDLGNGKFRCKCKCGNEGIVNVSSLRYGYSKSCGCMQGELKSNTLIKKYGEVATNKIDNPRQPWQIDLATNKEALISYIDKFNKTKDRKPTVKELSEALGIQKSATLKLIHKFEIDELINFYEFTSNGEIEVREFIQSIYNGTILYNKQNILNTRQELDIYIPDLKLAIEFNGNYWHCSILKDKKYHQNKTISAAKQGIRLVHIFEYEWNNEDSQRKIKDILRSIIERDKQRVLYARKLEIREIENSEAIEFCNKNHLQNGINSKVSIGLYNDTELVGTMTFGKNRYKKNTDEWEMYRLAYKAGTVITGGAERMLKYFITRYHPTEIISYCDISKFTGNVYTRLGFKATINDITEPNYVWQHSYKPITLSRYQTMKHKLLEKGFGDPNQTEDEIMEDNGYLKIYDCGNLRFKWHSK